MYFDIALPILYTAILTCFETLIFIGVCLIQNVETIPKSTAGYFILLIPVQFIVVCAGSYLRAIRERG